MHIWLGRWEGLPGEDSLVRREPKQSCYQSITPKLMRWESQTPSLQHIWSTSTRSQRCKSTRLGFLFLKATHQRPMRIRPAPPGPRLFSDDWSDRCRAGEPFLTTLLFRHRRLQGVLGFSCSGKGLDGLEGSLIVWFVADLLFQVCESTHPMNLTWLKYVEINQTNSSSVFELYFFVFRERSWPASTKPGKSWTLIFIPSPRMSRWWWSCYLDSQACQ